MEALFGKLEAFFDDPKNPRWRKWLIATAIGLALIAVVFSGVSLAGILLLVILVMIGMYFGSLRTLVGSGLCAISLKFAMVPIKAVMALAFSATTLDPLFHVIAETGYIELIFAAFFFFHLLSFGTSCIRPHFFVNQPERKKSKKDDEATLGVTLSASRRPGDGAKVVNA